MGRITVFTRSDDLNSIQVLKELDRRGLPYEEIDLTAHPSKINDLIALVDAPSVPHVFFNTRYVGGLRDCRDELLLNWDQPSSRRYKTALAKYKAEIASSYSPANKYLKLPSETDVVQRDEPAVARRAKVVVDLPDGSQAYIRELTECLVDCVPRDNFIYQGKKCERSFTGRTLVVSLQEALSLDFSQACRFAKSLVEEYALVRHVSASCTGFSGADEEVYRLACQMHPEILNSYLSWPTDSLQPADCLALVENLQRLLDVMEFSSIDPDDGLLNAPHCLNLKKFSKLEEAMCELQHISTAELMLMTEEEVTSFALNLYQVLVRFANLKIGIPSSESSRLSWLQHVKFILAGDTITLQDWTDILLNKRVFMGVDSRNGDNTQHSHADDSVSMSSGNFGVKTDKRIHFCLLLGPYCGGSQWSAPFSRYSPDCLEEQLEMAARAFCHEDQFVRVDRGKNKLELLSCVFKLHMRDFCHKEKGLPEAILPFLSGKKRADLMAMIKNSRDNKAIQINYVELKLGGYTIDGPWFREPHVMSKGCTIVIRKGSQATKSVKKAMAAKHKRLSSVGSGSTFTPSVTEQSSISENE